MQFSSIFRSDPLQFFHKTAPAPKLQCRMYYYSPKTWQVCCTCVLLIAGAFIAYSKHSSERNGTISIGAEEYHNRFLKMGCNETLANHLRALTKEPHVAGTLENFAAADYVLSTFQKYGLDAHYTDYQVLLSYPLSRSLSLSLPEEGTIIQFELKEKAVGSDPYTKNPKVVPTFHAYSPSANVSGQVVYANYGRKEDFAILQEMGIDVSGAIVIAKYAKIFRGDIVENAAIAGAVGVVVYSDPRDFKANGTQGYYPDSKWLPPSGVQRGNVYRKLGDPLTPGWPSSAGSERLSDTDLNASLPKIPSIPISAEDALTIMKSLQGPVSPAQWHGALNLSAYRIGPGPAVLNLHFKANLTVVPIRNVFGHIRGFQEPDRYVLLGNHRDAWTFGAADPNSGTASLLEIARGFGKLLKQGWRPRRSIIFCNWDAEEYSLIGSTEWVEQNSDLLFSTAIAYLNVDVAVMGSGFFPSSTPQLDDLLQRISKQVEDPDNPAQTVYQSWASSSHESDPQIGRLGGAGSDYASFLQHVGVPAIDLRFGEVLPVYHSLYDDYIWMAKFGDPLFHRNVALAAIWGLMALKLADTTILPFNYTTYAENLQTYAQALDTELKALGAPSHVTTDPLHKSIAELRKAALRIKKKSQESQTVDEKEDQRMKIRRLNDRLVMAERAFTDAEGLPEKSWYKHLIYGPIGENEYGTTGFPGVFNTLASLGRGSQANNNGEEVWRGVQHQIWRVSRAISRASLVINGKFT